VRQGELIATRGPGSHLGEIALLAARPRTATLVASTPLQTRVASQREFSSLLAAVPMVAERLQASMAERLAA
jgi:CRP-like cAMP-binding protein